jgi:hypothetical protein
LAHRSKAPLKAAVAEASESTDAPHAAISVEGAMPVGLDRPTGSVARTPGSACQSVVSFGVDIHYVPWYCCRRNVTTVTMYTDSIIESRSVGKVSTESSPQTRRDSVERRPVERRRRHIAGAQPKIQEIHR